MHPFGAVTVSGRGVMKATDGAVWAAYIEQELQALGFSGVVRSNFVLRVSGVMLLLWSPTVRILSIVRNIKAPVPNALLSRILHRSITDKVLGR